MGEIIDLRERLEKEEGITQAMMMLKEMDFEDFKNHICYTLHNLLADVCYLQNVAFTLSLL